VKRHTIILADDHVLFRRGLKKIIEEAAEFRVIGEAGDGFELMELLKEGSPDLVILDISMPNLRGLEATREIKRLYPQIKVLLLTMHKKPDFLQQGIEAGAEGFLLKEDADSALIYAIRSLLQGERFISSLLTTKLSAMTFRQAKGNPLTSREKEVMKLVAEGKTSQEIADLLFISVHTVRRHRDNIMRKLNLKTLADLVKYALDQDDALPPH
jgi:DNA-binding NarL/FixJ family response regulator